jgi:hypothetical protein
MKIGIIHEGCYTLEGECRDLHSLYNFSISSDELSFFRIFYSAFATPARYVMELLRRLNRVEDGAGGGYFIFNPFLTPGADSVRQVLTEISAICEDEAPIVITDRANFPLGYYLPSSIQPEDGHLLTLLSTVDGILDQKLLNKLFFSAGESRSVNTMEHLSFGNGFMVNDDLFFIFAWTAANALSLLERLFPDRKGEPVLRSIDRGDGYQLRALRDAIPFTAVMPHHAGDVLFYALAAKETASHVRNIAVNRRYVNILEKVVPGYRVQLIDPLPPNREGNIASDEQSFIIFAPDLPPFSFYYYCRQVRNYNISEFNLIDHFGFALGQSFYGRDELITQNAHDVPLFRPAINNQPPRILFHFDAGWGLKIYPEQYRQKLIRELLANGVYITVLGTEDRDFGDYRSVKFTTLEEFEALLESHHLLVGSDSFPSHYAAHVKGLPTLCLFGPTKPANSDARLSGHYHYLEKGISCRPCIHTEFCHTLGKAWCNNFVPPELLLQELNVMLKTNYGISLGRNPKEKVQS